SASSRSALPALSAPFSFRRPRHARSTLFPYTTLFRSARTDRRRPRRHHPRRRVLRRRLTADDPASIGSNHGAHGGEAGIRCPKRSEEHTSELQSRENLVCRLLLEKKKRRGQHTKRTIT